MLYQVPPRVHRRPKYWYPSHSVPIRKYQFDIAEFQWPKEDVRIFKTSYYVLAMSWGCLVSVHLEEVLYWVSRHSDKPDLQAYMLRACQNSGSAHWFSSIWFKLWAIGTVVAFGVVAGSVAVSDDLQKVGKRLALLMSDGDPPFLQRQHHLRVSRHGLRVDVLQVSAVHPTSGGRGL